MERETVVDDIPLRVSELHGKAGDVFVCHPLLFHCGPVGNVSDRPRFVRTLRVYR